MPDATAAFLDRGWTVLPPHDATLAWVRHVLPAARAALADPANAHWLRCGGTWFAGVNVLRNDRAGRIGNGPALAGPAMDLLGDLGLADLPLDRGQLSVVWPGYPRPRMGESDAAFRYRRDRDAAHVDGLLKVGESGRRMARETHGYILGLPLTETSPGASPLVAWEGSHRVMADAFRSAFGDAPPETWSGTDLTESYHAARRQVFETCRRVALHAPPGGAVLLNPLVLHGISPWGRGATAPPEGRMTAYFRPEIPPARWLALG